MTHTPEEYGLDPEIVSRVKKLCDETNSKIIIASNWRKFNIDAEYGFGIDKKVKNPLPKVYEAFKDYIIGTLPPERHISKAFATVLWFEDTDFKGKFVIFDDDLREEYQTTGEYNISKHFILTNREFGITEEDIEKAKQILTI